jgi:DNA-directed RNA polymerase specialized sigma24 family protein
MNIAGYLEQYRNADRRAKKLRKEYEEQKRRIDEIRSPLGSDGLPHGSGISKIVEERAIRLADKLLEYEDAELDAIELRQEVFDVIDHINGIEGEVLYEKYVNLKTWESVAEAVNVNVRTVYKIRIRALKKIKRYIEGHILS